MWRYQTQRCRGGQSMNLVDSIGPRGLIHLQTCFFAVGLGLSMQVLRRFCSLAVGTHNPTEH